MLKKIFFLCASFISVHIVHANLLRTLNYFSKSRAFINEVNAFAQEIEHLNLSRYAPTVLVPKFRSNGVPSYLTATPQELAQWRKDIKRNFDFKEYCKVFGMVVAAKNKSSTLYDRSAEQLRMASREDFLAYRWHLRQSTNAFEKMSLEMHTLAGELEKIKNSSMAKT